MSTGVATADCIALPPDHGWISIPCLGKGCHRRKLPFSLCSCAENWWQEAAMAQEPGQDLHEPVARREAGRLGAVQRPLPQRAVWQETAPKAVRPDQASDLIRGYGVGRRLLMCRMRSPARHPGDRPST